MLPFRRLSGDFSSTKGAGHQRSRANSVSGVSDAILAILGLPGRFFGLGGVARVGLDDGSEGQKIEIQRYKGLGEMNAEQLWETTMNPENRTLYQVTLEQLKDPNKVFSDLMGDDVEPRREFILKNAQYATNIDV